MPFSNPVVGGTTLIRDAIQSPNYTAGSAGWSINSDGTAEFNNGNFRGIVQLYDSQGNLRVRVDENGLFLLRGQPSIQFGSDWANPSGEARGNIQATFNNPAYDLTIMAPAPHGYRAPNIYMSSTSPSDPATVIQLDADEVYIAGKIDVDAWTDATLTNGWTVWGGGYANPGYLKTPDGTVHLRGLARGDAKTANTIFTLPAGYRPTATRMFVVGATDSWGLITVASTGAVTYYAGTATWMSLDTIRFQP